MNITRVLPDDDLPAICAQLQPELWGEDNDLAAFDPDHLRRFLSHNGILLLAREGDTIVGQAMCYALAYPSGEDHFYVHEVDTHPAHRRKGIAEALMREALVLAKDMDMSELWVATEHDNEAAKALYEKLGPTETDHGPTFAFTLKN